MAAFPRFNDQAVTAYEHGACRELSQGSVDAVGAENIAALGMILENHRIVNLDQFKLVFHDPDVKHVDVYDLHDKKIGALFLKGGNALRVYDARNRLVYKQ